MTTIAEVMTRDAVVLSPDDSIQAAARAMEKLNVASLPVCDGARLVGMLSVRDIAMRAVTAGLRSDTQLRWIVSESGAWCYDDEDLRAVREKMTRARVRRLPVVDHQRRLVGMVSANDLAAHGERVATLFAMRKPCAPRR